MVLSSSRYHGERVLLNSDGDVRVPLWLKDQLSAAVGRSVEAPDPVGATDVCGDLELLREFDEASRFPKQP